MTIQELQNQIKENKAEIKRIKKENRTPFYRTKIGKAYYSTIATTMSPFAALYNNAQSKRLEEVVQKRLCSKNTSDLNLNELAKNCLDIEQILNTIPEGIQKIEIEEQLEEIKTLVKNNSVNPFLENK